MERPIYMYSLMKISSHPMSNCMGISDCLKGFQSFYTSEPLPPVPLNLELFGGAVAVRKDFRALHPRGSGAFGGERVE